jgi:hypothetical protein
VLRSSDVVSFFAGWLVFVFWWGPYWFPFLGWLQNACSVLKVGRFGAVEVSRSVCLGEDW